MSPAITQSVVSSFASSAPSVMPLSTIMGGCITGQIAETTSIVKISRHTIMRDALSVKRKQPIIIMRDANCQRKAKSPL